MGSGREQRLSTSSAALTPSILHAIHIPDAACRLAFRQHRLLAARRAPALLADAGAELHHRLALDHDAGHDLVKLRRAVHHVGKPERRRTADEDALRAGKRAGRNGCGGVLGPGGQSRGKDERQGEAGKLRRQALSYAINREEIAKVVFNGTRTQGKAFAPPVM